MNEDDQRALEAIVDHEGEFRGRRDQNALLKQLSSAAVGKLEAAKELMAAEFSEGGDIRKRVADELLPDAEKIIVTLTKGWFQEAGSLEDGVKNASTNDRSRTGELRQRTKFAKKGLELLRQFDATVTQLKQKHPSLPFEPKVTLEMKADLSSLHSGDSRPPVINVEAEWESASGDKKPA